MTTAAPIAIIFGGAGQLGTSVVEAFNTANYTTVSVDIRENSAAGINCVLDLQATDAERAAGILSAVGAHKAANTGAEVKSVICVAGGWCGGSVDDEAVFEQAATMWSRNVAAALLAAHVAAKTLAADGSLVLTGAQAGLEATPGMIAYGIAKAATIQLVSSLAAEGSGLPAGTWVGCIMPLTLDTPTNREAMPDADFSQWTPLATVADLLVNWANAVDRPATGSLTNV